MTTDVTHRTVETNGIRMHLAEAGKGPLVVLCHGFPESWYSWRHQLAALGEAGFRAVAPDMRGYGQTGRPEAIDQYTLFHMIGDMVGLLDSVGAEQAVIAGHDWGANAAWHAAQLRPDRFRGVVGLSVPFRARGSARPTTVMPQTDDAYGTSSISRSPASPRPNTTAMCARCSMPAGSRSLGTRRPPRGRSAWCRGRAPRSAGMRPPRRCRPG